MQQSINFINVSGGSIPKHISKMLSMFAISMYQSGKRKFEFSGDDFAGVMRSDFDLQNFVFVQGVHFEVELFFEDDSSKCHEIKSNFLVEKEILAFDYTLDFDYSENNLDEICFEVTEENVDLVNEFLGEVELIPN